MTETRDPSPAVTRSLRILGLLADANGAAMTLSEVARALGLAKSSTANLCGALEDGGMIQRTPRGYLLGRRTAELGGAFARQFNQVREFFEVCAGSDVLRREVVQIATLVGADTIYLARHEGRSPDRIGTPLGSRLPAALSATGNALLAAMTDEQVRELLADATPFPRLTEYSIRSVQELLDRLHEARELGYAVDPQGSYHGVIGVAVPLEPWTPSDPLLGMGAALPADRVGADDIARVGAALVAAAAELTNPFAVRGGGLAAAAEEDDGTQMRSGDGQPRATAP